MKKNYYYYILKVEATKGYNHYIFYKIGEADNKNRPANLCAAYTKTAKGLETKATQISFEPLPINNNKR